MRPSTLSGPTRHRLRRLLAAAASAAIAGSPAAAQVAIPAGSASPLPGGAGTGLNGQVWDFCGGAITIPDALACQINAPTLAFRALVVDYPLGGSGRTFLVYLGANATDLLGGSTGTVTGSSWLFTGFVRVDAPAALFFNVRSDDGFRLRVGGVDLIQFNGNRSCSNSTGEADFAAAGLYPIELVYWEYSFDSCLALGMGPTALAAQQTPIPTAQLFQTAAAPPGVAAPEPATLALLGAGLAALALGRRVRRR